MIRPDDHGPPWTFSTFWLVHVVAFAVAAGLSLLLWNPLAFGRHSTHFDVLEIDETRNAVTVWRWDLRTYLDGRGRPYYEVQSIAPADFLGLQYVIVEKSLAE